MVLFFKRDCAGGAGPAVEAPRAAPPVPVVAPAAVPAVVVAVDVAGAVVAEGVPLAPAAVDGAVSAGFGKRLLAVVAGCVVGAAAAVVAAVVVVVAVGLGAPRLGNSVLPDGAAADIAD